MTEKIKKFSIELIGMSPVEKKYINRESIMLEILETTRKFLEEYKTSEDLEVLTTYQFEICNILTLCMGQLYKDFNSLCHRVDKRIIKFLEENPPISS